MGWERRLAYALLIVAVLLFGRVLWRAPKDQPVKPAFLEKGRSFYPIYFSSQDAQRLIPEFKEGSGSIEGRLQALIAGPKLAELTEVLPPGVQLIGYELVGDLIYVNFSHHLISAHPGGSRGEIMSVYGIVNTLVEIEGIEKVQILVEGERLRTLVGHLDLGKPLRKDYSLLGSSLI